MRCSPGNGTELNGPAPNGRCRTRQCNLRGQLLERKPPNPKGAIMSKIEKGKLLLREQLDAMSKGENIESARVLRDYELDFASGGIAFNFSKMDL